ncbi:MAG TPA: hypothetical protein V6D08_12165 [Candidatus Obscuribacterales bacterium]
MFVLTILVSAALVAAVTVSLKFGNELMAVKRRWAMTALAGYALVAAFIGVLLTRAIGAMVFDTVVRAEFGLLAGLAGFALGLAIDKFRSRIP